MFESVRAARGARGPRSRSWPTPRSTRTPARAKKVNRRYAELSQIVGRAHGLAAGAGRPRGRAGARDGGRGVRRRGPRRSRSGSPRRQEQLRRLLIPRDPDDGRDVIMEIKGGEGGEESRPLRRRPPAHVPRTTPSRRAGRPSCSSAPRATSAATRTSRSPSSRTRPTPPQGVWAHLKYEGGVHRVQRVPADRVAGPHPHLRRPACSSSPRSTSPRRSRSTRTT